MSLRVWLPLTGDLHNQGISDVIMTLVSGNAFTSPGKIGSKSLHLTKLQTILPNSSSSCMYGAKQISYAYWVKVNTAWETNWLDGIRWIETNGSATSTARQEFYTNCTLIGTWYKGGSISGKTFTPGAWMHIAATFNYNNGEAKFYINGSLSGSTTNIDTTYYCRGDFYIGDNGVDIQQNDVRIYDHCLSATEVKEIAQGLICHYKLDESNINLVSGSNLGKPLVASALVKYVDGTWGNLSGGNGTITILTDHTAPIGPYVYCIANNTSGNKDVAQYCRQTPYFTLTAGKKYTMSCYYKGQATSLLRVWDATNGTQLVSKSTAFNSINEWIRISYTFTATNAMTGTNDIGFLFGISGNGNGNVYVCGMKVEFGEIATEWRPSQLELTHLIFTDSSGYGHNLPVDRIADEIINNPDLIDMFGEDMALATVYTVSNSPRYKYCTAYATGANQDSAFASSMFNGMDLKNCTIAAWIKPATQGLYNNIIGFYSQNSSTGFITKFGMGMANTSGKFGLYSGYNNSSRMTASTVSMPLNEWHHYAITFDNGTVKFYYDGEYKQSLTAPINGYTTLGNTMGFCICNNSDQGVINYYSDVRAYVTTLLDTEIKQLYNVGMKVDKLGNIHTFAFEETIGNTQLQKTGVLNAFELNDDKYYDQQAKIGKKAWGDILHSNYHVITTKDQQQATGTVPTIPAAIIKSLAGKTLKFSYDVCTAGQRLSEETGETAWNKIRYGIHGSMGYTNAAGTTETSYPFAGQLTYAGNATHVEQSWTIPTGYQAYGDLGWGVQPYDKPSSTNNNTWFISNVKLEVSSETPSGGWVSGTQLIER